MGRSGLKLAYSRPKPTRPRSFTASERVIEHLSDLIMSDTRGYVKIAQSCGVSHSTIRALASRTTRWPRPATFFAVLLEYDIELSFVDKR